jgi:decaprenyl-phosphate phosphoribosyltransferase
MAGALPQPVDDADPDAATARPPVAALLLRTARPKQWPKNVLVFAAPGAAGVLDQGRSLGHAAVAFAAFSIAASGTYFLNDAADAEADRGHPRKRLRPVAAGHLAPRRATAIGAGLLLAGVLLSFAASWELAAVVAGYVALTVSYSVWLKHEAVLDLAAVAAGFVLRMIGGAVAVGVPVSEWFLIVAGAGSFFVVTGKRSAEHFELGDEAEAHRASLGLYSPTFLLYLRALSSGVAILAYCLWAFESGTTAHAPVWYQLSIVPFVLGVLRYALLLDRGKGGSPEDLALSDPHLVAIAVVWSAIFFAAVYVA